jgi:hypothetical protein
MLARPDLSAIERRRAGAGRRSTLARRAGYRQAVLHVLAAMLDDERNWGALADVWDLTETQAEGLRRDIARVLRNRAENHEGRLRV